MMTYEKLRSMCIRYWGFHPETKGTIRELWADVNKRSGTRKAIAEPSAYLLFDRMAEFADEHSEPERPEMTPAQARSAMEETSGVTDAMLGKTR